VFQIQQSSKVKISQATASLKKHLLRLAQSFFLMDAEGVQRAGFGQQGKL